MAAKATIWNTQHASRPSLSAWTGSSPSNASKSLTDPDKLLSLSFWRDEEAVAGWRACAGHRGAQSPGRRGIFRDYRLRVAAVSRDYGMSERREQAPADSRAIYDVPVSTSRPLCVSGAAALAVRRTSQQQVCGALASIYAPAPGRKHARTDEDLSGPRLVTQQIAARFR